MCASWGRNLPNLGRIQIFLREAGFSKEAQPGGTDLTQLYVPKGKGYVCQDLCHLREVLINTVVCLNGGYPAAWGKQASM